MKRVLAVLMLAIVLIGCGGNPYQSSIDKAKKVSEDVQKIMDNYERDLHIQRMLNDHP